MAACLCHAIRPEAPNVVVGVLQHPREAQAAKSTGSLLPLAFTNAFRLVGVELGEALDEHLSGFPQGTVGVLFPEDARPIAESPPLRCLLVPDGSWSQAELPDDVGVRRVPCPATPCPGGSRETSPSASPRGSAGSPRSRLRWPPCVRCPATPMPIRPPWICSRPWWTSGPRGCALVVRATLPWVRAAGVGAEAPKNGV